MQCRYTIINSPKTTPSLLQVLFSGRLWHHPDVLLLTSLWLLCLCLNWWAPFPPTVTPPWGLGYLSELSLSSVLCLKDVACYHGFSHVFWWVSSRYFHLWLLTHKSVQLTAGHFHVDTNFIFLFCIHSSCLFCLIYPVWRNATTQGQTLCHISLFPCSIAHHVLPLLFPPSLPQFHLCHATFMFSCLRGHNNLITCLSASRAWAPIHFAHWHQINLPEVPFCMSLCWSRTHDISRITSRLICLASKALYCPFPLPT